MQVKERVKSAVSILLPNLKEQRHQDIEILIILKDKDILKELLEQSFTIQEEDVLSLKSNLEIHININTILNISQQLKELTLDNIYSQEEKQQSLLEIFSQLIESQKVQLFAILNLQSEIKAPTLDVQEHTQLLLDIQMMEAEQELDYHQVQEKLFQEIAEPQLELLLVEEECKNQS